MKRRFLVWAFMFICFCSAKSQSLFIEKPTFFWGINLVSIEKAPIYLSIYRLTPNHIGTGLKFGLGGNNDMGYIGSIPSNSNLAAIDLTFKSQYYFATPVFIPFYKAGKGRLFALGVGFPIGYCKNELKMVYSNDFVYRNLTQEYKESSFYQGLEVEIHQWFEFGKLLVVKTGLSFGLKINGEAPFKAQLNNLNESNFYFPGMYQNKYLNISLGLSFRSFKK